MKAIRFDKEKDKLLKETRGFGFLEVFHGGKILDVIQNTSQNHKDQEQFVIYFDNYIWLIPFVEEENYIFFKTMFKSRKLKNLYIKKI